MNNAIILISIVVLFSITSLAIAYSEEDVDLLLEKGKEAYNNREFNDALTYFDKVLEIEPNNVDALNNKGGTLSVIDKRDEAISYFNRVLEIEPNNANALSNKGSVLGSLGEFDEAVLYLDKALEIDQNHTGALFNRAIVLIDQGNYYEAIPYFHKLMSIDPSNELANMFRKHTKNALEYKQLDGFVEFIVRDSNEKLVGYYKTNRLHVLDHEVGWEFIDEWPVTREFSFEGKNYEVLQTIFDGVQKGDVVAATVVIYNFEDPDIWLIRSQTWGFPLKDGDHVTKLYTIFREIE